MMPTRNATTWLREHAHNLLPFIGLLVLLQAPVTAFFIANSTPGLSYVDLGFGALGGLVSAYSKNIDSKAFTQIQVATATAAANQYIPPNVQHVIGTLTDFQTQVTALLGQMQQAAPAAPGPTTSSPPSLPPPSTPAAPTPPTQAAQAVEGQQGA